MRWWKRYLGWTAVVAVVLASCGAAGLLYGLGVTGNMQRSYSVVKPDDQVSVEGRYYTAKEVAQRYQPIVRMDPDHRTPALDTVYYETVDSSDERLVLIYHLAFADRKHPNPLANVLSRVYRSAYGTVPPRDFVRVLVEVGRTDGAVLKVSFLGADHADDGARTVYNDDRVQPHPVRIVRAADGSYSREVDRPNGTTVTVRPVQLPLDEHRISVAPVTWNHLLDVTSPGDGTYREVANAELVELNGDRYADFKLARVYTGDYATAEDTDDRNIAIGVATAVCVGGSVALVPALRRRRRL